MYQKVVNQPETRQTLKTVFEAQNMAVDAFYFERDYLLEHLESLFETILRKEKKFPNYLDYLPQGAITRKMEIIDKEYDFSNLGQTPKIKYFYGDEDLKKFVEDTAKLVYDRIVCINHKR